MRLALRELHRRPGRFAVAAAILTLIAVLLPLAARAEAGGPAPWQRRGVVGCMADQAVAPA